MPDASRPAGRSPKLGFEGGQTPLRQRVPKRGFRNPNHITYLPLNLSTLLARVQQKRLDPSKVRLPTAARTDAGAKSQTLNAGAGHHDEGSEGQRGRIARDGPQRRQAARPGACRPLQHNLLGCWAAQALNCAAAQAAEHVKALGTPLHLQVSSASASAREAVEAAGAGPHCVPTRRTPSCHGCCC